MVSVFWFFVGCKSNGSDEEKLIARSYENTEKGDYQSAIDNLQACIRINPNNPEAYNRLGINYDYIGEYRAAMDCYKRSLDLDPDFAQAWVNLGNSYSNKGRYNDAIDCYQKALSLKPHLARVYYYMGLAYDAKGDKETGIQYIKQSARMTYDKAQQHLRGIGETW